MANTLLSPTIITKEALVWLHQAARFIKRINKQYDSQFANEGASPSGRIGPTLTIRMPNQFTVRNGSTLSVQDVTETTQTLTVSTVKGIDTNFTTQDFTLTIDQFAQRYLKPAMARLAADIEKDALTMVKDVYNMVDDDAAALSFLDIAKGRQKLDEFLAPDDGERALLLCPTHNTKFIDAVKGLFNPTKELAEQYRSGFVGAVDSLDAYTTSLLVPQATGTAAKVTTYTVNGANQTGAAITIQTGATTFKKGDIVTFAGCNACHPETKDDYGYLQQFTVTADYSGGGGNLAISPAIVVTGATQNVVASPTSGGNVVKVAAGASETYTQSVAYHRDAFTIVTADLIDVSKFGAWGARQKLDGISMRIARQYEIVNDKIPTRIDVLYGFKTIRPQLAVRIHADG